MNPFPVPVSVLGPGSQPQEVLDYLPMPAHMAVFRRPVLPDAVDTSALGEVRVLLARLLEALRCAHDARLDLEGLAPATLELLNQTLGEGEVSAIVHAPVHLRIQETSFAGVWRVRELREDGGLASDRVEVCAIPSAVGESAEFLGARCPMLPPRSGNLMNAPALLAEILDHAALYRRGAPAHVINLTLLPVSPEDHEYLAHALGTGPATILSRGYGNCRITSTRLAHVWRVQYFNSVDKLILDTLEVVDVPEVALAARQDFEDSAERLGEWLAVLAEE